MSKEEDDKVNPATNTENDDLDDEKNAYDEAATREAARKRCYKYQDPPKSYSVNVSRTWTIYVISVKLFHVFC